VPNRYIDSRFIDYLEHRKSSDPNGARVTVRGASPEDPGLEPSYWDLALIVDVFHHVDHRVAWLEKVHRGLRSEGRVAIVDFKQGDFPGAPPEHLRLAQDLVRRELEQAGFTDITTNENLLPRQYVVTGVARSKRQ
jgi:SAM-dependent methyltransferase